MNSNQAFLMKKIWRLMRDSNRPGHMFAATACGAVVCGVGVAQGIPWVIQMGATIPLWEGFATPDMDHSSRRFRGGLVKKVWLLCWLPYQRLVPHRSSLSHSLLIGLPIRLLYVASLALTMWLAWQWVAYQVSPDIVWDWVQANPTKFGDWLLSYAWVAAAAAISDFIHLMKDGYLRHGLKKILFGV